MMWLNHVKIGRRLVIVFAIIGAILLTVCAGGVVVAAGDEPGQTAPRWTSWRSPISWGRSRVGCLYIAPPTFGGVCVMFMPQRL